MLFKTTKSVSKSIKIVPFLGSLDLKFLALIFMFFDHVFYFFEFTDKVPGIFTVIGRLSAYLFLFCAVEGFSHTHNRKRYFMSIYTVSIGMGLILHLMEYHHLFIRKDGFYPQNAILMNLVLLCIMWQGIDWYKERKRIKGILCLMLPIIYMFISVLLRQIPELYHIMSLLDYTLFPNIGYIPDGGIIYIVAGVVLYATRGQKVLQLTEFAVLILIMQIGYRGMFWIQNPNFSWFLLISNVHYCQWISVFTVIFMALYNGEKGSLRIGKSFFHWFYPIHIYILYAISCFI